MNPSIDLSTSVEDEMDINLPAAINRIDLLWHEIGKWIRKT
jgi:hypothetical protein